MLNLVWNAEFSSVAEQKFTIVAQVNRLSHISVSLILFIEVGTYLF